VGLYRANRLEGKVAAADLRLPARRPEREHRTSRPESESGTRAASRLRPPQELTQEALGRAALLPAGPPHLWTHRDSTNLLRPHRHAQASRCRLCAPVRHTSARLMQISRGPDRKIAVFFGVRAGCGIRHTLYWVSKNTAGSPEALDFRAFRRIEKLHQSSLRPVQKRPGISDPCAPCRAGCDG